MSSSKVCNKCNIEKDIVNFCKNRGKCKDCRKKEIYCIHSKIKYRCKPCNGRDICPHDKIKTFCKSCKGGSICPHDKVLSSCKECRPPIICNHNKRKNNCRECKPSICCEHNVLKSNCKICNPDILCCHYIIKSKCKDCNPKICCEHNVLKFRCKVCKGNSICIHDKRKDSCRECGNSYCQHDKRKDRCIECDPNKACPECKSILSDKRNLCYPLCQACFCNKYPDHEKSTLYKIKERYLRDELRERFPNKDINMIFDKAVNGGCSGRKPDVMIDLLTHTVIIECDEHQHRNYECENRRTMELYTDLGNRPLVMIRFNPDKYTHDNKQIEGCFKPLINIEDIHKKKFYDINNKEWKRRVDILQEVIKEYIDVVPDKAITEIKLFYSI